MSVVTPMIFKDGVLKAFDSSADVSVTTGTIPDLPPEGTPKTGMLVGAVTRGTSSTNIDSWLNLKNQLGPLQARRSYDVDLPQFWDVSAAALDVGVCASVWSAKPDMVELGSGNLDDEINALLDSIPVDHVAFLTVWHEMDSKIKHNQITWTLGQIHTGWQRFCDLVHSKNRPNLMTYLCVGDYSWIDPEPGTTLDDLWPGDGYFDIIAFDGYASRHYESSDTMWGTGVDFANAHNAAWAIAEIGFLLDANNERQAAIWMQEQADYAANTPAGPHSSAAFMCWFNSAVGDVLPCPESFSETMQQAAKITTQYNTPYQSFVLGG